MLRSIGCSEGVINHCLAVSRNALEIASRVKIPVDMEFIEAGAMLHDMGRCKTHGIDHAVVGAALAMEMGLPEEVARIIERHIGAGISVVEAMELGLPEKDYFPLTPEEKIVSYADNLTDAKGMLTFEEVLKRFERALGKDHPALNRFRAQHEEIMSWIDRG